MLYSEHNFDIRKSYYSNQSGFNSVDEVLQSSLYTDVALFFSSFFSKTSASEANPRTLLRWRSINPLWFIFYHPSSTDFEEKMEVCELATCSVTCHIKATEQYVPVVMFIRFGSLLGVKLYS